MYHFSIMKTKVSVLGEAPNKELNPIELMKCIERGAINITYAEAWKFEVVTLVGKTIDGDHDLILCESNLDRFLYLGHWNDGVVSEPDNGELVFSIKGKDIAATLADVAVDAYKTREVRHD